MSRKEKKKKKNKKKEEKEKQNKITTLPLKVQTPSKFSIINIWLILNFECFFLSKGFRKSSLER